MSPKMFLRNISNCCLLLLVVIFCTNTIQISAIVTNYSEQTTLSSNVTIKANENNENFIKQSISTSIINNKTDPLDRDLMSERNNATFYYDPDSFLIQTNRNQITKSTPARDISARNGRMLDLDELVGDFAQANLNRQNRISGSRQSRILHDSLLDVGHGKKLSVQGFIPILSIKDINQNEKDNDNLPSESISKKSLIDGANQEDLPQLGPQGETYLSSSVSSSSLPYSQSSPGHASTGIKPYPDNFNGNSDSQYSSQQQYGVDAKNFGSSSSLLNPFKKPQNKKISSSSGLSMLNSLISSGPLANLGSSSGQNFKLNAAPTDSDLNQDSGDCVCVPFYMCRSGYLSESSLTKDQQQQLIQSQQQQQQQQQSLSNQFTQDNLLGKQNEELSPVSINNPKQSMSQSFVQQQQSLPYVDERSMDKLTGVNQQQILNETYRSDNLELSSGAEISTTEQQSSNNTQQNSATQYSQDILGRMLGIRNEANSCGVLRTCCRVVQGSLQHQEVDHGSTAGQTQDHSQHLNIPFMSTNNQFISQPATSAKPSSSSIHQLPPPSLSLMQSHQQQQQQNAVIRPYPGIGTSYNQIQPDSFSLRQLNLQQQPFKQSGLNSLVPNIQISPVQQQINLNQRASQSYIQTPLNHQMNSNQRSQGLNSQLQSYQPIKPYVTPSMTSSNVHMQYSQPPSNQYQPAHSPKNIISDYSRSGMQQQLNSAPQRHQMIDQYHQPQQQLQSLASSSSVRSSSIAQPSINQKRMLEGRCGIRNAAGITGRVQNLQYEPSSADFGEYPSQVAILKRLAGSDSLYVCAGTLISQQWIATAAHCIKKYTNIDLKVRLGEWDVHRDDEFYPFVEKNIRDIVIHPEFVAGNLVNDIALLRMDSPIDPSLPHISPACLPNSDETFVGLRCWVTGWGKDTFGQKGTFQSVLKEVDLPITSHRDCEQALRQTRLGQHYRLHSGFICAGGEGGKDACEGDGGSGLYCVQDGLIKAIGLVSWGIGCGQTGVPGVYVNLAHYRIWIENIISVDEDLYSPYPTLVGSNSLISERSPGANISTNSNSSADNQSTSKQQLDEDQMVSTNVTPVSIDNMIVATSTSIPHYNEFNQTSMEELSNLQWWKDIGHQ